MTNGLDVLMLLSDGFGGVGGIAKFNRDFLKALDGCSLIKRVHALPRMISEKIVEPIPEVVIYDRTAARGRAAFMFCVAVFAWRARQIDLVICGHLHLLPAAWLVARLRRARLVLIIHGVEAWTPSRKVLANWLARTVDGFIAVSGYSAERFVRWSKVALERAYILPNCVDLDQFKPQQRDLNLQHRYGLQSTKVILTVGRLASQERYKGVDQVIEMMPRLLKRFSTLKYLVVGDGDDRPRLTAKAAALGLSQSVIFTGRIPESEKVAHYNLADAYVMPSTGEGFGIVLIEAAACGVPVVGSRTDGSREALLDGRLGQVIDPGNPNELAETVTTILEAGCTPRRIDLINGFSVQVFSERVAAWCRAQMTCSAAN